MSQHMIKTPNLSLFLGRRNTGKSTLMIHLLRTLAKAQKFAWVRVYSPTAFTGVWGNIVGEDNVEAVFDNDELESILETVPGWYQIPRGQERGSRHPWRLPRRSLVSK